MASWEVLTPRRTQKIGRVTRWPGNIAIVILDIAFVRILFPVSAVALAMLLEANGSGLFNVWQIPIWLAIPLAVIILDFVIYLQHVLFHAIPLLWRLHRMHHADLEFDITTGTRFHPIEIMLSMTIKLAMIAALGAPAVAVLIFEILLNATPMFNHSNVRIPTASDHVLRWFVVTPDMHRVHHSVLKDETNSNYGFNLPWWDPLANWIPWPPPKLHILLSLGRIDFGRLQVSPSSPENKTNCSQGF